MKRAKSLPSKKGYSNSTSDKILGKLVEIDYKLKVLDEKNNITNRELRFEIASEAAKTRQELSQEFNSRLGETENRLNKRITKVIDLLTINVAKKLGNHQKRIKKLEEVVQVS